MLLRLAAKNWKEMLNSMSGKVVGKSHIQNLIKREVRFQASGSHRGRFYQIVLLFASL